MSTYYITGIEKDSTCTSVQEINQYRISSEKSDSGTYYTKKNFFDDKYSSDNSYYSYNPTSKTSAECEVKKSSNNEKYLQTVGNGTKTDNLLSLPCK
jgi:Protein of unknown function (DUF3892)